MVESVLIKKSASGKDKVKKETLKMSVFNLDLNIEQVEEFLKTKSEIHPEIVQVLKKERIDAKSLVTLHENELSYLRDKYDLKLGNIKQLMLLINKLKQENYSTLCMLNLLDPALALQHRQTSAPAHRPNPMISKFLNSSAMQQQSSVCLLQSGASDTNLLELNSSPPNSETGFVTTKPDFFKTIISLGEFSIIIITFLTSLRIQIIYLLKTSF